VGIFKKLIGLLFLSAQAYAIVGPIPGPIPADHPASYNTVALVKKVEGNIKYKIFCSGLILGNDLIATAKHCLGEVPLSDVMIYFGDDTNHIDERLLRAPVSSSIYGPSDWQSFFPSFDAAWITIAGGVPNADGTDSSLPRFRAVPVLTDARELSRASAIYLAGYGNQDTNFMEVFAGEKKYVQIGFKQYFNTAQVASLVLLEGEKGHSNCHGDSGGPAYALIPDAKTGQPVWYMFGTAAGFDLALTPDTFQETDDGLFQYVAHCDSAQTLYTFTGDYVNWIQSTSGRTVATSAPSAVARPGVDGLPAVTGESFRSWCEGSSFENSEWLTVRQLLTVAMAHPGGFKPAEVFLDCSKAENLLNKVTSLEFTKATPIGGLGPVAVLTGLTDLSLEEQATPDLQPLAKAGRLQNLTLRKINLKNPAAVSGFTGMGFLQTLKLNGDQIEDVSALAGFTALTSLDVNGNQITDLAPLANLKALTYLDFGSNGVQDLTPIYGLNELQILIGSNNELVSTPAPAGTWSRLQEVYLIHNQLTNLDFLRDAQALKRKVVSENPLNR